MNCNQNLRIPTVALTLLLATGFLFFSALVVAGDAYPNKAIRFIVTYPPAGGVDIVARAVAQKLTQSIGQTVVIDNRPGAGGIVGMEVAARASPDGYTILIGVASYLTVNPILYKSLPYDPGKDFAPISFMGSSAYVLVVNPALPIRTTRELIAYAKANPGKLNYGSSPSGSGNHLAGELFKSMAGVDIIHVPYKGSAAALTAVLSSEVQVMFGSMVSTMSLLKSGKLRALAVTGGRSLSLPDLPTISEAALTGYYVDVWFAAMVPANTPSSIIMKLNSELATILQAPEIRQKFVDDGFEARSSTPEEVTSIMRSETAKWANLVKSANIRIE